MKQFKRGLAFLLAIVLVMSCLSVGAQAATTKKKATVKSVTITNPSTKTLVMKKGKTFQVKTKVTTTGKKVSKALTFASSNKKVATVSGKGKIKALANGKATITVTSKANKKKKATLKVVVKTPVTKVTLDKKELTLTEGEKAAVKATVSPKKATITKVAYTTSDKTVATVDSKGNITAVKEGKATITATAQDGNNKKATCKVTVVKKEVPAEKPAETPADKPADKPADQPADQPQETPAKSDLSYEGYELKWQDEFEGTSLSADDWNIEEHEPRWVNRELQEYVVSDNNIYVKDGALHLKAEKSGEKIPALDKNGNVIEGEYVDSYTSGRVNTQGKHDFKYGLFEAVAKVPQGQGFLPAFWMMPTEESLYGQWPRCGEIDAMEVMGQNTNKLYGTIHYGEPHEEKQGTYILTDDSFSSSYHKFSCEWEPGKITWYVDGMKYHETSDWFSATEGQGELTYPAPFDQPFYMILNLAVGGSWVGDPDEATFKDGEFVIDSVKVYQKDSYNENVKRPEKPPVEFKEADENGNYITNGDFAKAEKLDGTENWQFLTALGGEATAEIKNGAIVVSTTNQGTVDYSVQLVQPKIPAKQGYTYEVSFDAYASEARKMGVAVKAPDRAYKAYAEKNIDVTDEKQTYKFEYKMEDKDDANSRLEFNMGAAGSTATLYISNVSIKVKSEPTQEELDAYNEKKVLADGNSVYNGKFQEGNAYLGYWDIDNQANAEVSVTGLSDGRRLKVVAKKGDKEDVVVSQNALPIPTGLNYEFSFDAEADEATTISYVLGGKTYNADITTENKKVVQKISKEEVAAFTTKDLVFELGNVSTIYIDNVRLEEDALLKNGNFSNGFTNFVEWHDASASIKGYGIDSIAADNDKALEMNITNTSDADYKIQVKQENIELVEGKIYRLAFKAKSSIDRQIRVIMQGGEDKGWDVYSGENIVDLTSTYNDFEKVFKMTRETDPKAFLSICYGKVDRVITDAHTVTIDDIVLEEVTEKELYIYEDGKKSANLLTWVDSNVTDPNNNYVKNDSDHEFSIKVDPEVADDNWRVQLIGGVNLEQGKYYVIEMLAKSSDNRTIQVGAQNTETYAQYAGTNKVELVAGEYKAINAKFKMNDATDSNAGFFVSMGDPNATGREEGGVTSVVLTCVAVREDDGSVDSGTDIIKDSAVTGWDNWSQFTCGQGSVLSEDSKIDENGAHLVITQFGTEEWDVMLKQENLPLEDGASYDFSAKVISDKARTIKVQLASTDTWCGGVDFKLQEGENDLHEVIEMLNPQVVGSIPTLKFVLGKIDGDDITENTLTIKDVHLIKK